MSVETESEILERPDESVDFARFLEKLVFGQRGLILPFMFDPPLAVRTE